jgi:hypothetical protein
MKHLALVFALFVGGPLMADEAADLVKQLDSEAFTEREAAAGKLQELGKKAIPALTEAAESGALETTVRSIGILKSLSESKDEETAKDAKSALEKLAKSENAGTARRAENALTPKPQPVPNNRLPGGIRIVGNVVIGNNATRVRVSNNNGVKTIEVTENQREIKILDDPNKGITVEITEQQNGKKATEKIEAKDADELKKKHPKAHEVYEKYGQGNMGRIQLGGAALPIPRALPARGIQRPNGMRLEMAGRILKSYLRNLESLANDQTIQDADNKSRQSLKEDIAEMKKQLSELEKKLQSAIDKDTKEQKAEEKPADAAKIEN